MVEISRLACDCLATSSEMKTRSGWMIRLTTVSDDFLSGIGSRVCREDWKLLGVIGSATGISASQGVSIHQSTPVATAFDTFKFLNRTLYQSNFSAA